MVLRVRQGAAVGPAKLLAGIYLGVALAGGPAGAAVGRLFVSARQCESAKALTPEACRTAFANALAEFAAKAPTYRSRRACFKNFGPCMPWPIGTRRFSLFRPQWIGITVAPDMTAAPAVAPGHLRLDFAPQSTAALSAAAAAPAAVADAPPPTPDAPQATIMTPDDDGGTPRDAPAPRAGGGFTVIDGVLTYPAPARFQPKALKHP